MALFVGVGAMSLVWAMGIAAVVLLEKLLPRGVAFGRIAGTLLVAAAAIVLARPELAMPISGGR
jgi:predicted metal-binding membrane protein